MLLFYLRRYTMLIHVNLVTVDVQGVYHFANISLSLGNISLLLSSPWLVMSKIDDNDINFVRVGSQTNTFCQFHVLVNVGQSIFLINILTKDRVLFDWNISKQCFKLSFFSTAHNCYWREHVSFAYTKTLKIWRQLWPSYVISTGEINNVLNIMEARALVVQIF